MWINFTFVPFSAEGNIPVVYKMDAEIEENCNLFVAKCRTLSSTSMRMKAREESGLQKHDE